MQRPLRLRKSEDFARLRKAGRTVRHPLLMLNSGPNGLDHNRYGFVVPKKVGNAVMRNKLRRRLRALMARLQRQGELVQGVDLIWVVRNEAAQVAYIPLMDAAGDLLRRARLYAPPAKSEPSAGPGSSVGPDESK